MASRPAVVVAVTALALVAGGCGAAAKDSAKDFSGPDKQVASVVEELQSAGRSSDENRICDQVLAPALVMRITRAARGSCAVAVNRVLKDVDAFELQVVKGGVRITGATATARVRSASGTGDRTDTLQLVREPKTTGGRTIQVWKISALGR